MREIRILDRSAQAEAVGASVSVVIRPRNEDPDMEAVMRHPSGLSEPARLVRPSTTSSGWIRGPAVCPGVTDPLGSDFDGTHSPEATPGYRLPGVTAYPRSRHDKTAVMSLHGDRLNRTSLARR